MTSTDDPIAALARMARVRQQERGAASVSRDFADLNEWERAVSLDLVRDVVAALAPELRVLVAYCQRCEGGGVVATGYDFAGMPCPVCGPTRRLLAACADPAPAGDGVKRA